MVGRSTMSTLSGRVWTTTTNTNISRGSMTLMSIVWRNSSRNLKRDVARRNSKKMSQYIMHIRNCKVYQEIRMSKFIIIIET